MKESDEIIANCEKNAIPDSNIDVSNIPEITNFDDFKPLHPEYFKPKKEQVSIRFNKILLDHLREKKGWQSKVNDYLMDAYIRGEI